MAKRALKSPEVAKDARWLLFMPSIPAKPASLRVKVWRRLQQIGAVSLRGSVYVLPNREECVELFEWVASELREQGGQVSLCEGRFVDELSDDDIAQRLNDARDEDYAVVTKAAKTLLAKLSAKRVTAGRLDAIADAHAKLMLRFTEITRIDFVNAAGRGTAEGLLTAVQRALPHDRSPADKLEIMPRPRGATWVTRTGVHVDRIASAWLIRRFIDPQALLKFVPAKGYVPRPGELRFDMFEAEFTHIGDRCSFEVLVEQMGLDDSALVAIGEIIHDLDLRDDKFGRDEAPGVRAAIDGICSSLRDDDERIAAATPFLDGVYASFSSRARRAERR